MPPPTKALIAAISARYGSNRAQNILTNLNTRYLIVKVNSPRPSSSSRNGSASSPGLMMAASGGYRVKGKKGGPIKLTQMTVAQLKNMGAKYGVNFTAQNKTKKQILNKIYKAKQGGVNLTGNQGFASSRSRTSSSNGGGKKLRGNAILNQAASLGLMRNHFPASKGLGYRAMGKKGGPVKMNKFTIPQLKAYGASHGVNFTANNKTKKQIIAKIHAKKYANNGSNRSNSASGNILNVGFSSKKSNHANNAVAVPLRFASNKSNKSSGAHVNSALNAVLSQISTGNNAAAAPLRFASNKSNGSRIKSANLNAALAQLATSNSNRSNVLGGGSSS